MPTDPPLTEAECAVLYVLMAPESRSPIARTMDVIEKRSGLGVKARRTVWYLEEKRRPALVRADVDEGINIRFYTATPAAADALDEDCA